MSRRPVVLLGVCCILQLFGFLGILQGSLSTSHLIGDNMVLQRGEPIRIWGNADPGAKISVALYEKNLRARVGVALCHQDGKWMTELSALDRGQGLSIQIVNQNTGERLSFQNVCVGEVWVCAGQSNMEWPLKKALGARHIVPYIRVPQIRLLKVPHKATRGECEDVQANWQPCFSDFVENFSAIGFFFGMKLLEELDCPVGLIDASWGGTFAEAWTPKKYLEKSFELETIRDHFSEHLETYDQQWELYTQERERWRAETPLRDPILWAKEKDYLNADFDPDEYLEWGKVPVLSSLYRLGLRGQEYKEAVWLSRRVTIPPDWLGRDLYVYWGGVDSWDQTFVNGQLVGETCRGDWTKPRGYVIPADLVGDKNDLTLVVRLFEHKDEGGFRPDLYLDPNNQYPMICLSRDKDSSRKERVQLMKDWYSLIEPIETVTEKCVLKERPVRPLGHNDVRAPGNIFNGMIAPLVQFPVRGVLWYQGEYNAERARQYPILFSRLIDGWRSAWGKEKMPFYFVQLPNYEAEKHNRIWVHDRPCERSQLLKNERSFADGLVFRAIQTLSHLLTLGDELPPSRWAELRESQVKILLSKKYTGMAVTIDLGDPNSIHPLRKKEVGERLAFQALRKTYGKSDLAYTGPLCVARRFLPDSNKVCLTFEYVFGGLTTSDNKMPREFYVAGTDRRFHRARAMICPQTDAQKEANQQWILVWSDKVEHPIEVRYAWSDNPGVNLVNGAELPAVPFRTDNWRKMLLSRL